MSPFRPLFIYDGKFRAGRFSFETGSEYAVHNICIDGKIRGFIGITVFYALAATLFKIISAVCREFVAYKQKRGFKSALCHFQSNYIAVTCVVAASADNYGIIRRQRRFKHSLSGFVHKLFG